jgi:hypothetical protein
MRKTIIILFVFVGILLVAAGPRAVSKFTYLGSYGDRSRPSQANGVIYVADMLFDEKQIGYFTIDGLGFVAPVQTLTHVSGSCGWGYDPGYSVYAEIRIDDKYARPLFNTNGEMAAAFDITFIGTRFVIKINLHIPIGCNVLIEAVG